MDETAGDPSKAVSVLGFNPRATSFEALVAEMVASDIAEHVAAARVALAAALPISFSCAAAKATQCDAAALAGVAVEAPPAEEWATFDAVVNAEPPSLFAWHPSSRYPSASPEPADEALPRARCGGVAVAARVASVEARLQQLSCGRGGGA